MLEDAPSIIFSSSVIGRRCVGAQLAARGQVELAARGQAELTSRGEARRTPQQGGAARCARIGEQQPARYGGEGRVGDWVGNASAFFRAAGFIVERVKQDLRRLAWSSASTEPVSSPSRCHRPRGVPAHDQRSRGSLGLLSSLAPDAACAPGPQKSRARWLAEPPRLRQGEATRRLLAVAEESLPHPFSSSHVGGKSRQTHFVAIKLSPHCFIQKFRSADVAPY